MIKFRFYLALLFAFVASFISFAHDFEVNGIYYNINDDGTSVSVTYNGSSYDLYTNEVVIPGEVTYNGTIYSVKSIGDYAFYNCSGLTSVTMGNSVTSIGDGAFEYCSGLTSIEIPNSVTSIGSYVFSGCSGLTKVVYNAENCGNLSRDGSHWLYNSNNIKSFTIGENVKTIPAYLCYGLSQLTSITIPNSVTSIGYGAFRDCSGLTSVNYKAENCGNFSNGSFHWLYNCNNIKSFTIGENVQTIPDDLCVGLSQLTSITIPNSVTSIGGAFSGCSGLTSVTIGNSVTSIGEWAFSGCSGLTSVTIPNSVTSIGDYAFRNCSGLTSVTIGNSVTSIGDWAFCDCSGLILVTIPNSVTSIGGGAFSGCSGLTSVTIGNSVTSIGDDAFCYCNLTKIVVLEGNSTFDSRNDCNAIIETSTNTLVIGCKNTTIPNSVTSIGNYAFRGCSGLTSITIPNSVTSIGSSAFSDCSGLTSVTIPNSVTSIGGGAFYDCSGLTSVIIGNSVTSIDEHTFTGCSGLTSITIPNSVASIEECAFYRCSGLKSVIVGNGINYIDNEAFTDCTNLQKSAYPEVIPNPFKYGIGISYPVDSYMDKDGVIYDYTKSKVYFAPINLKEYTIPTSVSSIGSYAFGWCSDMQSVDISSSVNYIGFRGFYQCNTLSSIQCDAATPPSLSTSVFDGVDKQNCSLIVPDGSLEAYKAADQWKDFLNIGGVEEIAIEESNISIENGKIINIHNENIEVYNLSGVKVYSGNKAEVELNSGVYIVVIGNKAVKIAL